MKVQLLNSHEMQQILFVTTSPSVSFENRGNFSFQASGGLVVVNNLTYG